MPTIVGIQVGKVSEWGNQQKPLGQWFDTADVVGWGDGGAIELRSKDGSLTRTELTIEELFTGEDEIPMVE